MGLDQPVFDGAPIAGAGGPVGSGEHGISHGEALLPFRWQIRRSGVDRIQIRILSSGPWRWWIGDVRRPTRPRLLG